MGLNVISSPDNELWGANMITEFNDPFDTLFNLQRALEAHLTSDWLHDLTTSRGPFPPINIFQQGDDVLAIVELPGTDKGSLQIQAQGNTIRIAGKKTTTSYPEDVSVHRRERISGEFDRTISLPVELDPAGVKAEYKDGILALFLPRSERAKPRSIKIN
jgi:HSP20 family protein